MNKPGTKYFKGRILSGGTVCHVIIWDGIREYQNDPPPALAQLLPPGPIIIAQINERKARTPTVKLFDELRVDRDAHLILWARDHAAYRQLIDAFMGSVDCWLQ